MEKVVFAAEHGEQGRAKPGEERGRREDRNRQPQETEAARRRGSHLTFGVRKTWCVQYDDGPEADPRAVDGVNAQVAGRVKEGQATLMRQPLK